MRAGFHSLFLGLGNGVSSVEAWFSTALDTEEVLSDACDDQLHAMVAHTKSFDTVERCILDCALGRLGLLPWFRRVYVAYHDQVRLRFKVAAGLGAGIGHSPGMSVEHSLYCCFVRSLV